MVELNLAIVLKTLLFALLMGLLGGFLPALRAARLQIVEALRALPGGLTATPQPAVKNFVTWLQYDQDNTDPAADEHVDTLGVEPLARLAAGNVSLVLMVG